jgi:large subunit ribosomal protein L6
MSRVGKNPVTVPDGVELQIGETQITAKGKLGELTAPLHELVKTELKDGEFWVRPVDESDQKARAMWGTTRAVVQNMVTGVSQGFTRELEITGVGYRAQVQGKDLLLQLGFSHDIHFPIPEGVEVKCPKPTTVQISGANKQQVGQMASEIRRLRPPEPYKGKGVKYAGEQILRKEGKKK